jgi:hypothetical protein
MSGSQIPIPGPRWHWDYLREHPDAFMVIARNLIPLAGVLALSWAPLLAIFNIWFDGLAGMTAILLAIMPRLMRELAAENPKEQPWKRVLGIVVAVPFLVGILGMPYWIVLVPFGPHLHVVRDELLANRGLWLTLASIFGARLFTAFRRGYDALPEREFRQALRWDTYLLALRAIAMFVIGGFLSGRLGLTYFVLPVLALVLSYLEIWPRNALGAVFGDPDKLWQNDEDARQERRAAQKAQAAAKTAERRSRKRGGAPAG